MIDDLHSFKILFFLYDEQIHCCCYQRDADDYNIELVICLDIYLSDTLNSSLS